MDVARSSIRSGCNDRNRWNPHSLAVEVDHHGGTRFRTNAVRIVCHQHEGTRTHRFRASRLRFYLYLHQHTNLLGKESRSRMAIASPSSSQPFVRWHRQFGRILDYRCLDAILSDIQWRPVDTILARPSHPCLDRPDLFFDRLSGQVVRTH